MFRQHAGRVSYSDGRASWQPDSYAEMGAAAPFTTPDLAGARIRRSARSIEVTLPNPTGRRGIYILDPRETANFCTLSLHDRGLISELTPCPEITPDIVRQAARRVALAGHAGRAARAAAEQARQADLANERAMQHGILNLLAQQTQAQAGGSVKAALQGLVARTGLDPNALAQAIDLVARITAAAGQPESTTARYPVLLRAITELAEDVPACAPRIGRAGQAAELIRSAALDSAALAGRGLAAVWKRLGNITALLAETVRDPRPFGALSNRLDWLLDGWPQICLVWQAAHRSRLSAALNEMALMTPFVPAEAALWYGMAVHEAARQGLRAELMGFSDWRAGGLVHALIARNEALRALAA